MFDDEAPPNLYFHNSSLVRNISNQVELISNAEKLPDEEFVNLKLASVFLLTGFITDYEKPMEASFVLWKRYCPDMVSRRKTVSCNQDYQKLIY